MTNRLERIFSEIPTCSSFADVGCDHGFIAEKMILSGKAARVIVSDISEPSLQKAKKLLKKHIDSGKVAAICTDGLNGLPTDVEVVLIAGMGGEEIIKILTSSNFLPPVLILQPMKNVDKVRRTLFNLGYGIEKDYLFIDKKYYNLIVCKMGMKCESYSELEFIFGRDNLQNESQDFKIYLQNELSMMEKCFPFIENEGEKQTISARIKLFKEVLYGN